MVEVPQRLSRRRFLVRTSCALGAGMLASWTGPSAPSVTARAQSSRAATWTRIQETTEAPAARANHALVHDAKRDRLIVFGGRGSQGFLNDVWALSLANHAWQDLTPTGGATPAPRRTPALVYDPLNDRLVTYSGQGSGLFNDTWAFDLNRNQWTELATSQERPAQRYGTFFAYDSTRHAALTFAGFTSEAGRFDDTWRFSLDTDQWEELEPADERPGRRCLHMGSYDADRDRLMIYGGQRGGPLGDLWALDLATKQWRELISEVRPAPRMFGSMVYDQDLQQHTVFGGTGAEVYGDLWTFDPERESWKELSSTGDGPSSRHSHAAVWVPDQGMLLFGGRDEAGLQNDLWQLSRG